MNETRRHVVLSTLPLESGSKSDDASGSDLYDVPYRFDLSKRYWAFAHPRQSPHGGLLDLVGTSEDQTEAEAMLDTPTDVGGAHDRYVVDTKTGEVVADWVWVTES